MKIDAYYLGLVNYSKALEIQRYLSLLRRDGEIGDLLLLMEHNHVFTIGRAGKMDEILINDKLLKKNGIEVYEIERGGATTYHGPGQLVGYPIINLKESQINPILFLRKIEQLIIWMLNKYGIEATAVKGKTGVWVNGDKIASIGIHISKWITRHGFAINVCNELKYFDMIIPCGILGCKYTSISNEKGVKIEPIKTINELIESFSNTFSADLEIKAWDEDKFFKYYAFLHGGYFY